MALVASIADLKKDFKKLIENKDLAQGYLLFGHESAAEKLLFTKELANFFESKKWEAGDRVLSDALFLDSQAGDGGIDMVRAASSFLWQKPVVSQRRTLVIANADRLTIQAQSAILKIAEEPPANALIILIVKDPEALLPAVVSRFQKIFIAKSADDLPDTAAAKAFLKATGAKRKEILKELMEEIKDEENDSEMEKLVRGLFFELRKDPVKNYETLKNLSARWALIRQFNVNKKLQLEAALATI